MDPITFAFTILAPIIAIVGGYFFINTKLQSIANRIEHIEKIVSDNFERHREDHNDHHKEISKMFDGVSKELHNHIGEERVAAAANSKEHRYVAEILREIKKNTSQ